MEPSMTDQQQSREHETWIVVAEWVDSSPTHYGPFDSLTAANQWAQQFLSADAESWEPALLSSVAPSRLSVHTQRAIDRILDAAADPMTAVEYVGRHRGIGAGRHTSICSNYGPKHARRTVYLVVTGFRCSIAGDVVSGYLLADTGEMLATREAASIGWLERDLIHKAYRRLSELYSAWDVVVVPRDGEVPAEVEALRHQHMRSLGGVS